jgi:hypothetical protein
MHDNWAHNYPLSTYTSTQLNRSLICIAIIAKLTMAAAVATKMKYVNLGKSGLKVSE